MRHDESAPTPHAQGPWRLSVVSAVVLLIVLPGLYLASRDQPSALSNQPEQLLTPVIGLDQGCENFASFWLDETVLALDPAVIEAMTNCRLAADGTWIVPVGADDPRLPAPQPIPAEYADAVARVETELRGAIEGLESSLSASIVREMESIYNPIVQPVLGNLDDRESISRARSRYSRVVQAYVLDPQHELLAGYIGWVMERRRTAYDSLRVTCREKPEAGYLELPCQGLEDTLSIRFVPWPWDLRNDVLLQEYLAHRVETGQIEADASVSNRPERSGESG